MSALGQKQTYAAQKPMPLYPQQRPRMRIPANGHVRFTSESHQRMSAKGQKRTFCNAAETGTIRSPHRRETAVIVALRRQAPSRSAAQFSMQSFKPKARND